jgi:hypothetical protein
MIINSLANIYPKALLNYAKLLRVSPLTHNQTYGYFADDLMLRRIVESKPSIYLPASHLYLDSLINQKFNEKLFCMLLIELDKKMIEE